MNRRKFLQLLGLAPLAARLGWNLKEVAAQPIEEVVMQFPGATSKIDNPGISAEAVTRRIAEISSTDNIRVLNTHGLRIASARWRAGGGLQAGHTVKLVYNDAGDLVVVPADGKKPDGILLSVDANKYTEVCTAGAVTGCKIFVPLNATMRESH